MSVDAGKVFFKSHQEKKSIHNKCVAGADSFNHLLFFIRNNGLQSRGLFITVNLIFSDPVL